MEYRGAIESKSGVCKENERNRNRDRMVPKLEWAIVPCGNKRAPAEFMNEGRREMGIGLRGTSFFFRGRSFVFLDYTIPTHGCDSLLTTLKVFLLFCNDYGVFGLCFQITIFSF